MLSRERELCVLHVSAPCDREALEALSCTTRVLAARGFGQVLLVLDDGRGGEPAWPVAGTEVRRVRCPGLRMLSGLHALQAELLALLRERSPCAFHLHGTGACLLGSRALRGAPREGRVLYSLDAVSLALPWAALLLGRALQGEASRHAVLAASRHEAQVLSRLLNRSAEVVPHPVGEAYFAARREEAAPPCVAADGAGAQAIDRLTRLSVLLNGRAPRVAFSWLGPAQPDERAQLEAANVELAQPDGDAARARALARSSFFIHLSSGERWPRAVAEAMAAGVPCLVSDTPAHRDLVEPGETGYVCTRERDLLEKAVLLLRERDERRRLGAAARAAALRSFTLRRFESAVLRAYGFSPAGFSGASPWPENPS